MPPRANQPRKTFCLPVTTNSRIPNRSLLACMRNMERSKAIFFKSSILLQLLCLFLLPSALAISSVSGEGHTIHGRVKIDGAGAKGFGFPGKTSNAKIILNGGQRVSFLRPDGYFSFHNVPAGTHLIEVSAMGYFFSPVRIDVSARNHGKVQAALTETRRALNELVLEPLREEQYYEIREPFSVMSLLKSPMGLMLGFMVIVVFLMPKLMESMDGLACVMSRNLNGSGCVTKFALRNGHGAPFSYSEKMSSLATQADPEEMKRAQEEMRNQGVPSIANLLPRSG